MLRTICIDVRSTSGATLPNCCLHLRHLTHLSKVGTQADMQQELLYYWGWHQSVSCKMSYGNTQKGPRGNEQPCVEACSEGLDSNYLHEQSLIPKEDKDMVDMSVASVLSLLPC